MTGPTRKVSRRRTSAPGMLVSGALTLACTSASPSSPAQASAPARACDSKDACFELGERLRLGTGGSAKDPARAARAYEEGCEFEHAAACDALGVMYYGGEGVPKDDRRGDAFEDRSCTLGHAPACFALAYVLATNANQLLSGGGGVSEAKRSGLFETAKSRAQGYLDRACDLGNPCACLALRTGDCNVPGSCSVPKPGGGCRLACSEELGCDSGTFAVLADARPGG